MYKLFQKHIEMVDAVNDAKTESEHDLAIAKLQGYREAMDKVQGDVFYLIAADNHSMQRFGNDRPMCAGVLLDWEPQL